MVELLRFNVLVFVMWLLAVLLEVDIIAVSLDKYASNIQGSSYTKLRRMMVFELSYGFSGFLKK